MIVSIVKANSDSINCSYINKLIVDSINLQMNREQWVRWQELMIFCSSSEQAPLSELMDMYRCIPIELNENISPDVIRLVNKRTGEIIGSIHNLAL